MRERNGSEPYAVAAAFLLSHHFRMPARMRFLQLPLGCRPAASYHGGGMGLGQAAQIAIAAQIRRTAVISTPTTARSLRMMTLGRWNRPLESI